MTSIQHHLTDALLMGYATGTLPEAFSLIVATHISLCDECRAWMGAYDALGGAVMTDTDGARMTDDSLATTLEMIARGDAGPTPKPHSGGIFPTPLQDYVGGDLDAVKWRWMGGGVSQALLKTDGGPTVRLLRIPGGTAVPDHGHRGTELTLVLQGAFRDETSRFGLGDVEVANQDMSHRPVAEDGPDCICLAATDAPLKFNAIMPRLAQPFLGI